MSVTSIEKVLETINHYYINIAAILDAMQTASKTTDDEVMITLTDFDGKQRNLSIASFAQIRKSIEMLNNNFKSILSNGEGFIYGTDGSVTRLEKKTFLNAQYIDSKFIKLDSTQLRVDKNRTFLNDFIFPSVKLPITINKSIGVNSFVGTIFNIKSGYEYIENFIEKNKVINMTDLTHLESIGKISFEKYSDTLNIKKTEVTYFGKFTIESLKNNGADNYTLTLDKLTYSSKLSISDSVYLRVGDMLATPEGANKYVIEQVDTLSKSIKVTQVEGTNTDPLTTGVNKLVFCESLKTDESIVELSIRPNQKLIVFLSVNNPNSIGFPSNGIVIDTQKYKVTYEFEEYTIDEFFGKFVTNFADYLLALVDESSIPASLGIKPETPALNPTNFKVVHINTHISDTKTIGTITKLHNQKSLLINEINYKQSQVNSKENELNNNIFNTLDEKDYIVKTIERYRRELIVLKQNLSNITKNIDEAAIKYGIKNYKPKYKVIGFWPIQIEGLSNSVTGSQKIIKYEVEYRYLSKNRDTVENITFNMIDGDNNVQVTFSNWNRAQTTTRNKVRNNIGKFEWEELPLESADVLNINNCSIPITFGESVEIRCRAVSEAGYPLSPLKSEWSNLVRIDFPDFENEQNVFNYVNQNNEDLTKNEFVKILIEENLLPHIADRITEGERTFEHQAKSITSGQFTPEQKNIPLDVCIANIIHRLGILENRKNTDEVIVQFTDFQKETYNVKHNTTLDIYGGAYLDNITLNDPETLGSVVEARAYITIKNPNQEPIEIKTLAPGNSRLDDTDFKLVADTFPEYHNVPVRFGENYQQLCKQILYFRNRNIDNFKVGSDLVVEIPEDAAKENPEYFTQSGIETSMLVESAPSSWSDENSDTGLKIYGKDYIYYQTPNGGSKGFISDKYNGKGVAAFHFDKELRELYGTNQNIFTDELFPRLATFSHIRKDRVQRFDKNSKIIGFGSLAKYMVGQNTCGMFLYPMVNEIKNIQVIGNNAQSTMLIPGYGSVIIPIVLEYRMVDHFGNIDGVRNNTIENKTYTKTIGVDMLIGGKKFSFDIKTRVKLKSEINLEGIKNRIKD